ncbi:MULTISPECIES: heavy metal-associated domain-containing protein [unclassified Sulfurospirillum]|uniref:heavy-metal-associated domain-containing protein n=1 Tax=unclassified Sulfurospirillum TaxID=2618290 RepID=UPI0005440075|nr:MULTISPECIES: heavy metal-associated domain-containing protein [unclassified Sulfurospirillum]KHG34137.1 MAG: mercury transporter [Sulfurospirillum sp. MES]MCP3652874.1 heavy-metal-associated domain-containing protein [Sulfurospirillum sp. DNRA8]MCR1811726.1 heavy-metal-associated domain-containing protein [Sulfurospirillum sp. DNRA8]
MKKWLILLLPLMLFAKEEVVIKVAEMHCPLCTTAVKKALKSVEGVESSKVTLETKLAVVIAKDGVKDKTFLDAVKTTGYEGVVVSRKQLKE